jgi:uncharacterized iron-regulated membrane protein
MQVNLLQFFRKTHLYVGVFTTPAILFFALSGSLQTFSLHETTKGSAYKPPHWILVLAQVHKKQSTQVPQRKALESNEPRSNPDPRPATAAQAEQPIAPPPLLPALHDPLPLRIFFLLVGLSLFVSTASGLYLAWKYRRDRVVIAVLLLAGILIPIALMQL